MAFVIRTQTAFRSMEASLPVDRSAGGALASEQRERFNLTMHRAAEIRDLNRVERMVSQRGHQNTSRLVNLTRKVASGDLVISHDHRSETYVSEMVEGLNGVIHHTDQVVSACGLTAVQEEFYGVAPHGRRVVSEDLDDLQERVAVLKKTLEASVE